MLTVSDNHIVLGGGGGGGDGSGDVVGAASSTDNAIARFDGTTGKVVQNSNTTLDDNGAINIGGGAMPQTMLRAKSSGSGKFWRGRIVAGGDNSAFLLGEYDGMAWLGAHNADLTAWADIYINPNNSGDVHIGGIVSGNPVLKVLTASGRVGVGTAEPTAKLDINSDALRLRTAKTPATSTSVGNQGDMCWDANYLYVCVAANTWKRSAIAAW
jgi:hypothetical protein